MVGPSVLDSSNNYLIKLEKTPDFATVTSHKLVLVLVVVILPALEKAEKEDENGQE